MSLKKEIIQDKIEIVGDYKSVQIRTSTVIKENDKEISRSYNRHALNCLDDTSGESAEVKAICNAVWTDEIKAAYQNYLERSK